MSLFFNALILLGCATFIVAWSLYCYIALFWVEKFRLILLQQPEYRPGWFYLIDSTKKLKWWHLYRRFVFTYLIGSGWIPNPAIAARSKSFLIRTVNLIMPMQIKMIYRIIFYATILMVLAIVSAMTIGKIYHLS